MLQVASACLAQDPELLGIGLSKVAGRDLAGFWGRAACPAAGNQGQLLQISGQALPHDGD